MNATQPPSKRSRVERTVDTIIFFMFGLLFSMCITGCAYFAWWTTNEMYKHWYLLPGRHGAAQDAAAEQYNPRNAGVVAVTNFITAFILYGEGPGGSGQQLLGCLRR
jgi:phospholipid-translocating ATPase